MKTLCSQCSRLTQINSVLLLSKAISTNALSAKPAQRVVSPLRRIAGFCLLGRNITRNKDTSFIKFQKSDRSPISSWRASVANALPLVMALAMLGNRCHQRVWLCCLIVNVSGCTVWSSTCLRVPFNLKLIWVCCLINSVSVCAVQLSCLGVLLDNYRRVLVCCLIIIVSGCVATVHVFAIFFVKLAPASKTDYHLCFIYFVFHWLFAIISN